MTGTILITILMLIIDYRQQEYEKEQLQFRLTRSDLQPGKNIDQLLLTGNDLSVTEKNAFINIYLKSPEISANGDKGSTKNKRDELYRSILQRRINRTTSKPQEDFSVRPVPK